ncbi:hypothetical protein IF2G_03256 [Cordyceps javanica]|nr:hypothetical protein IF2G_03256 [Cordyceps javanica]
MPRSKVAFTNRRLEQPDGYLTEERKAQDPDQGFSTFFSETGTATLSLPHRNSVTSLTQRMPSLPFVEY